MWRKFFTIIGIVVCVGVGLLFLSSLLSLFLPKRLSSWSKSDLGVITIEGTILSADETLLLLDEARRDASLLGVIVRFDSPGGSVGASQELLEGIKRVAEKKPVVASFGSVAASGAYYAALGATKILANPGTVTGSIGVRMEHVELTDLLKWAMVHHETLKSGHFKDIGSFNRAMTPEERVVLVGVLEDLHQQFKDEVAKLRKLEPSRVDELADGRVFTGREALKVGLVDALGGYTEAITQATQLAGIKGEPHVIDLEPRQSWWEHLFAESSQHVMRLVTSEAFSWEESWAKHIRMQH